MKVNTGCYIFFDTADANNGIYWCLERENWKILKFHVNNFCYFEIRVSLF